MKVILNGEQITIASGVVTYEYLAARAGFDPKSILSITYRGTGGLCGSLTPGESVMLGLGMIFNVVRTGGA